VKKILAALCMFTLFPACSTDASGPEIRKPAFSGTFYPSDRKKLSGMIDSYLQPSEKKEGRLYGIIVPHAGYIYSGKTAGSAFSRVKGKKYSTVILLGSSHNKYLNRPVTCSFGKWETPLGTVEADPDFIMKLKNEAGIEIDNGPFIPEHSLEVELPFLQKTLSPGFKIVPILINDISLSNLTKSAKAVARAVKENRGDVLFVMSTDMTHYKPAGTAERMDKLVSEAIEKMDAQILADILLSGRGQLCGGGAVILGILTLKELGCSRAEQYAYSHSGETTGDNSSVVGYGAFGIYKDKKDVKEKNMGLNDSQKKELLKIARTTITEYVKNRKIPEFNVSDSELTEKRGVFVTLYLNGKLKGCIGSIMSVKELYLAVRDMAIESSTQDPRFTPVSPDEIDDIEIEISVLTVPQKVKSADEIVLGRDGVIVKKGFRQGVYLPQVADETGWSKEEFLSSLCYSKAGLPADAWKDGSAEIYTFQAEVFNEKELNSNE